MTNSMKDSSINYTNQMNPEKAKKACLGFEPGSTGDEGWKAETNPLSYGGSHAIQAIN